MPDWDENSPQLVANLTAVLESIRDSGQGREQFGAETARRWHREMMAGLEVPREEWRGAFRGEADLEGLEVRVGMRPGVRSMEVAAALEKFDEVLHRLLSFLDEGIPSGSDLSESQIEAVLEVCARVHAEWGRIHPFANLPPFVRLRPRPQDGGYALAAEAAMTGNPDPTIECFRELLGSFC